MKIISLLRTNTYNSFYKFPLRKTLEIIKAKEPMQINELIIAPQNDLITWNHTFFPENSTISLPVFSLGFLNYTGENVVLDHEIFNQPVRKDLIHRVMLYNKDYNRKTFKWVKSKAEVSGSNRKPFQQKKTGRARQGCIRSPNLYHGGRAHGERPREFYFPMNKKVRLLALKSILTARLIDKKIIIVDKEKFSTNHPGGFPYYFEFLKGNPTLFVTGNQHNEEFVKNLKQVPFVNQIKPASVNVFQIINTKFLIFTKNGIAELMDLLKDRKNNYFRNKKLPKDFEIKDKVKTYNFDFDVTKKMKIYTPALKGSMKKIMEDHFNPQILENKLIEENQIRKAKILEEKELEKKRLIEAQYNDDSAISKRRAQEKKLKKMMALKEQRREKIKTQKKALQSKNAKASAKK